jgi:hypothetical protein
MIFFYKISSSLWYTNGKELAPELHFAIAAPGGNLISAPAPQHCTGTATRKS